MEATHPSDFHFDEVIGLIAGRTIHLPSFGPGRFGALHDQDYLAYEFEARSVDDVLRMLPVGDVRKASGG